MQKCIFVSTLNDLDTFILTVLIQLSQKINQKMAVTVAHQIAEMYSAN